ncbi:hypothetical protein B0G80_1983 [Paraburkholderia sp. BL6669N2]|nr:hypothetical protein B0G80_1983 [Paraburkholderia sp. BL6669N2]TDY23648.1 hypothetical protein B0G81_4035 [Paraburkholderia sp. BL6665CI2N2]
MRGPTDEEWKRMTPEQKRTYKIFVGVVIVILVSLAIKKFFF